MARPCALPPAPRVFPKASSTPIDRKSTRLNSSHGYISYAVFCLKKKTRYACQGRLRVPSEDSLVALENGAGGRALGSSAGAVTDDIVGYGAVGAEYDSTDGDTR